MTITSAWRWLSECDAPVTNGDPDPTYQDCWPSERYPSDGPDCAGVQSVRETPTNLRVGARNEHQERDVSQTGNFPVAGNIAWVCNDCGQDRYGPPNPAATWHHGRCDICVEEMAVTEPRDFGNRHDVEPIRGVTSPADSCVVESCPECGTVTDIEYPAKMAGSFDVPFLVQEFMFEELCEEMIAELPHYIFDHSELIIEMARDRFHKGFAKYGSAAYQWDAETRLANVLEELADAVVYLTTGSVE